MIAIFSHDYTLLAKQGMVILIPSSSMRIRILHRHYHWGEEIRFGSKADLLRCIRSEGTQEMSVPMVNTKFFDGAAIVQMLTAKIFQQYSDTVFMPYISSQLKSVERVDIVWDVYIEDSLKRTTRQNRGKGVRRRVLPQRSHITGRSKQNRVIQLFGTACDKHLKRRQRCLHYS